MLNTKSIYIVAACLLFFFCGCGRSETEPGEKKTRVVVTTVPLWDWTRSVIGGASNAVEIIVLQDAGVDLHDYQPTARDIIDIGKADIFIHVGGVSDAWVPNVLAQVDNGKRKNINALSLVKDMMKKSCSSGCGHDHHHHGDHHHADARNVPDEHIWLSLRFAQKVCSEIGAKLAEVRPEHKDIFLTNAKSYCKTLAELDESFVRHVSASKNKVVLIADRFPFIHFFNDYSLTHFAAFEGCSAESDASFRTIMDLSKRLAEHNLSTIYTLEGNDGKIAKKIMEMAKRNDAALRSLNSMQNVPLDKFEALGGYVEIMKKNIEELKASIK